MSCVGAAEIVKHFKSSVTLLSASVRLSSSDFTTHFPMEHWIIMEHKVLYLNMVHCKDLGKYFINGKPFLSLQSLCSQKVA
jgi:hypothetical protein